MSLVINKTHMGLPWYCPQKQGINLVYLCYSERGKHTLFFPFIKKSINRQDMIEMNRIDYDKINQ